MKVKVTSSLIRIKFLLKVQKLKKKFSVSSKITKEEEREKNFYLKIIGQFHKNFKTTIYVVF